jgi:hypothetical protein
MELLFAQNPLSKGSEKNKNKKNKIKKKKSCVSILK